MSCCDESMYIALPQKSKCSGTLSTAMPTREPTDIYFYDPAKPVTFITDASFAQIGGPDDYRAVEERADVLAYTSEALTDDIEVCGPIRVRLAAASSARDTDFMAHVPAQLMKVGPFPAGIARAPCLRLRS
jgi:predicted acyl esterase